jgi:putative tryptophan/tyrosine transport system substrate-binding protein
MKRREFIAGLGSAVALPIAARAQHAGKLPTIGFLGESTPSIQSDRTAIFVKRLQELGWIESRTVAIEYRWGEGRLERFAEIAAEFVRLKVDVIVTSGNEAVLAVKQATTVIPIVGAVMAEPVRAGIIASLARPGGNVTGLSNQTTDVASKRVEMLREVVHGIHKLGVLADAGTIGALEVEEVRAAAHMIGLDSAAFDIRSAEDIGPAFERLKDGVDALYIAPSPLVLSNRARIHTLAMAARLPTMWAARGPVQAGGLMSYGPDFLQLFRRAAEFVDKILRGTKAGDIPVEQPTRFELVVNRKTAKALGLTIPESFLLRADEVIE